MAKSTAYTEDAVFTDDNGNDHPMIHLFLDERDRGHKMGVTKAKRVLANMTDIKAFVAKHANGNVKSKAKQKGKKKGKR